MCVCLGTTEEDALWHVYALLKPHLHLAADTEPKRQIESGFFFVGGGWAHAIGAHIT